MGLPPPGAWTTWGKRVPGGIPATGRQVRLPYAVVYELADGAITALNAYLPVAALANQLRA